MQTGDGRAAGAPSFRAMLQVTRLIAIALASGLLIFLVVVFIQFGKGGSSSGGSSATLLTFIAAGMWCMGVAAGFVLYRQQLAPGALGPLVAGLDDEAALRAMSSRLQVACLMRWALLEGPGLFASVVLFLYQLNLRGQPVLVIDLGLALLSAALILLTRPSEDSVRELLRTTRRSATSVPRR